jgi:phosphoglycolate phosphatase
MMKSAIIFDFDYTLADSSRGAVDCINYALQSMGEEPRSWNDCCATIGLSLSDTYISLTRKNNPEKIARFHRLFVERADQVMAPSTELYGGVKDLVHRLTSSNFVLGILSTKFRYRICQILERYELTDQFSVIVGGEDIEKSKPDPEGLHLFLSKTSIKPEQAVLVGDSLTDAETALRGGIDFIAVLTGTTSADQFTDYSPKAVLDSVTGIESKSLMIGIN